MIKLFTVSLAFVSRLSRGLRISRGLRSAHYGLTNRQDTAIGVVYPHIRLESREHGVFVEHVYQPDFVFVTDESSGSYCKLVSLDTPGRRFDLIYEPKSMFVPAARGTSAQVARLVMLEENRLLYAYEFPELTERANYRQILALPEYAYLTQSLQQTSKKAVKSSGMPLWGVVALVVMSLLTSLLLFSGGDKRMENRVDTGAKNAAKPLTQKAPVVMSSGDQLNDAEKVILSKVVGDSGIEWSTGGKPFVVFSDPNCPACRELETRLASLDKSLSAVIVPVSFKKNSREVVAGVLCAKVVATAWKLAASGNADTLPVATCPKGEAQADSNNAAFVALHFDSTPTIVTSTGKVAAGAKDFEGLVRWIKENSNE